MLKMKFAGLPDMDTGKLAFNSMLWLVTVTVALLTLPESLLSLLGIGNWVNQYNHFIGLGMLVGLTYFAAKVINILLDEAIRYLSNKRIEEHIELKVSLLDLSERALLREFFLQGATIVTLPQQEPAVQSLLQSGIIECLGNEQPLHVHGIGADYKISLKARSHLNRQVLGLPPGQPSAEEMRALIKTRPAFISNLMPSRKHAA